MVNGKKDTLVDKITHKFCCKQQVNISKEYLTSDQIPECFNCKGDLYLILY